MLKSKMRLHFSRKLKDPCVIPGDLSLNRNQGVGDLRTDVNYGKA